MTKPSVGIIGCGWLGKALTTELITQHHNVIVTTQRPDNVKVLEELGTTVECFSASPDLASEVDVHLNVFKQSCLIVAITPKIRQGKKDYAEKIAHIVKLAEAGCVNQIILVSSTAIYNGHNGNVDESATIDLSQEKTNIINKAEQEALAFQGSTIVLRLAGLVGPNRHPSSFLKSKRMLSNASATTNLIHQQDAVGLLLGLINYTPHTAIYNGSSKTNLSKREYYEKAALFKGLTLPKFSTEDAGPGKLIDSSNIRSLLNYHFIYDDLVDWLEQTKSANQSDS